MGKTEDLDIVFNLLRIAEFRINSGFFSLCTLGFVLAGDVGMKDFYASVRWSEQQVSTPFSERNHSISPGWPL